MLKSKIRDIRLTATLIDYEGSITLDEDYMEQAGIIEHEEVHILNRENGQRFTTYAIPGKRGSGAVELNGPAARLGMVGDQIMVLTYAIYSEDEVARHKPVVVSIGRKQKSAAAGPAA
jgi:aspartate 1-decarboxylase